VLTKRDLIIYA
jgi:hypothetical protein